MRACVCVCVCVCVRAHVQTTVMHVFLLILYGSLWVVTNSQVYVLQNMNMCCGKMFAVLVVRAQ